MRNVLIQQKKKDNRIGNVLRRNCLLKDIIKGKIEVSRRRERRSTQLMNDHNKGRGYWKLKRKH